jgi:putative pyruvate formate lyase activating enzyme
VHNINLVTPTHFTYQIAEALCEIKKDIKIPIVWNSSGYELVSTLECLRGIVDIFLCDVKYYSEEISREYSHAPDYFETAEKALGKMLDIAGEPCFNSDGIMHSGVILRHLVLPQGKRDSQKILEELSPYSDKVILSLMCQYTPTPLVENHPVLSRRTTTLEYRYAVEAAKRLGYDGYIQDKASAQREYTPNFNDVWDFDY